MYYMYHIPGKKIGVTTNIAKRVIEQQGYKIGEFDIMYSSDNIEFISNLEIEAQKEYGYKVDRQSYKQLTQKPNANMKINVTEQTTTFPCAVKDLSKYLGKHTYESWQSAFGKHELDTQTIIWILANARVSMFNDKRCYVYNKALSEMNNPSQVAPVVDQVESIELSNEIQAMLEEYMDSLYKLAEYKAEVENSSSESNVFNDIRSWAQSRGIYEKGDSKTQYVKLMEEAGELARAILKNDRAELTDAIGDMVVVLTNLAYLEGMYIEDCVESALKVISNRKGKMVNGTFQKETL
jgi:NTP pyrophosphatase (non-canonical NTP hydrolase)